MKFEPMVYGNVKGYFKSQCGQYVICKSRFGWLAYVGFGTAEQKLLSSNTSVNSRTGAEADCRAHAGN